MQDPPSSSDINEWYIANWPAVAWLETAIKLVGMAAGVSMLLIAVSSGAFDLPRGARLIQALIVVVLALGQVAAVVDRLIEREIVAMVFVVLNNIAHWSVFLGLLFTAPYNSMLAAFAGLFLVGDLVKIVFIRKHNFTVRNYSTSTLFRLTLIYVLGYAAILSLQTAA